MRFNRTTQPLIWLLILSCFMQAKAVAYSGGQGTKVLPYVLSCKQDIIELASRPADFDKSFILTEDIDLDGTVFEHSVISPSILFYPEFNEYKYLYTGWFNGNGHVIQNFSIIGKGVGGFFGAIGETGRVMQLGLKNVHVDGPGTSCVGMLAGINMGDIVGCYTQGHVSGLAGVGGLVGYQFRGRILDCFSQGTVEGVNEGTGGLVGVLLGGEIQRCYAAATVMSENSSGRGGLAGIAALTGGRGGGPARVVLNSFWDIDVSDVSTSSGGLGLSTSKMHDVSPYLDAQWDFADEQDNGVNDIWMLSDQSGYPVLSAFSGRKPVLLAGEGTLDKPYVVSTASELAAIAYYSYYYYCWYDLTADVDLSSTKRSAPVLWHFVGSLDGHGHCIRGFYQEGSCGFFDKIESNARVTNLRLEECEVKAKEGTAGCLAGENRGLVQKCSVTGIITGGAVTGGLVGSNTGSIWDCSFSGVIKGYEKAGGLIGENAGVMTNNGSRGAVSGDCSVGGLAGSNTGSIRSCYSTAAVIGYSRLGGLIGTNDGSVTDCHARGLVAGAYCIGGLVGQNSTQVSRCYSTGFVTGLYDLGGLIGCVDAATGRTLSSFWDIDSSGMQMSSGGTGVNRKQMQDINTFLGSGWDFVGETINGTEDIWVLTENGYPELAMSLKITPGTGVRR